MKEEDSECSKCGMKWLRRVPEPKSCPFCKSRKWKDLGQKRNLINMGQSKDEVGKMFEQMDSDIKKALKFSEDEWS